VMRVHLCVAPHRGSTGPQEVEDTEALQLVKMGFARFVEDEDEPQEIVEDHFDNDKDTDEPDEEEDGEDSSDYNLE